MSSDFATVIRGGTLVLPGADGVVRTGAGDLLMHGGRIAAAGESVPLDRGTRILYASGCAVLPGFVQTHVHLGHSLLRGLVDGLGTARWQRQVLWPRESAHTAESMRAAARLAVAELLLSGTTAIQAMETGPHVDVVIDVLAEAGMHAVVGRALMDDPEGAPLQLCRRTDEALGEAVDLAEKWDGAEQGRLRIALSPYSLSTCTPTLLREVARLARDGGWRLHTHAGGYADEKAIAMARGARGSVDYLQTAGIAGPHVGLASCSWLDEAEVDLLRDSATHVLHCPGSDARLGGGLAPVPRLRELGVPLSLGTDGAAANETVDLFRELRLAIAMQSSRHGPGVLPAAAALDMATRGGAAALGWPGTIGELSTGAVADVMLVSLGAVSATSSDDVLRTLAHGCSAADVRAVWLGGRQVVSEGRLTLWDEEELRDDARREQAALAGRAGV